MFGLGASQAPNVTNNRKGASSLAFSPSRLEHQTPNVTTMMPKANLKSRLALPNVSHLLHQTPLHQTSLKRDMLPQGHKVSNVTQVLPKRDMPQVASKVHDWGHKSCLVLGFSPSPNVTSPFAQLSFPNVTSCQANKAHSILPASPSRAPCFNSVQT
ncbi:hypothetical protein PIB30_079369 [Stylosanthes scabra]|uniref:Uncharacterized protein n=1 Tax=Stylosanthes scabra TaxID=79078 RepID=A0ABU6VSB2_9FABA|nr:hypothetical protein [Stylosanthes scabra]